MKNEPKLRAVLRGLVFPPRCCSCGEFLQEHILDTEPRALCEACRRKWEYAKLSVCGQCGEELSKCRCIPAALKRAGASALLKLVSYDKNRDTVAKRAILFMKRKNSRAVFDFFSGELAQVLRGYLKETYTPRESIFVSYVPRGYRNLLKSGVDQSERLAKGLASQFGCDVGGLLGRKHRFDKEQKRMGKRERLYRTENAFCLSSKVDLKAMNKSYRCLILVDDVVTTGASFAACVRLLKEEFKGRIVCLCLAQTEKT